MNRVLISTLKVRLRVSQRLLWTVNWMVRLGMMLFPQSVTTSASFEQSCLGRWTAKILICTASDANFRYRAQQPNLVTNVEGFCHHPSTTASRAALGSQARTMSTFVLGALRRIRFQNESLVLAATTRGREPRRARRLLPLPQNGSQFLLSHISVPNDVHSRATLA